MYSAPRLRSIHSKVEAIEAIDQYCGEHACRGLSKYVRKTSLGIPSLHVAVAAQELIIDTVHFTETQVYDQNLEQENQ